MKETCNVHCADGASTNVAKQVELPLLSEKTVPVTACEVIDTFTLVEFLSTKFVEAELPVKVFEKVNELGNSEVLPVTVPVPDTDRAKVP